MPYIKNTFSILAECAATDLPDTERVLRESEIRSAYNSIQEAEEEYYASANMVPVVKIADNYYTEAQFMAPFMRDAGIKSISEALNAIAEANGLPAKGVGLLIESECAVSNLIEKCCQKECGGEMKDRVFDRVGNAIDLAECLQNEGYAVRRKKASFNEEMHTRMDFHKKHYDKFSDEVNDKTRQINRDSKKMDTDDKYKRHYFNRTADPNAIDKDGSMESPLKTASYADAKARHDRRHPESKKESGMFDFDFV